ncbi:MAG: phage tail sheath family protein [Cyanobacteriota bacterium]
MAPSTYATPGIYVEEISTLPPSVAEIATAIPAFIGYTETHAGEQPIIKEIRSLRDYEESFGQAPSAPWKIIVSEADTEQFSYAIQDISGQLVPIFSKPKFLLWYAIDHYFRNGGGRCFIVSIGSTRSDSEFAKDKFINGIEELEKADDPTLVVIPEATQLGKDYGDVYQSALAHAFKMKDRFAILDTKIVDIKTSPSDITSASAKGLRDVVGTERLDRGAAYYPDLKTTLSHRIITSEIDVFITKTASASSNAAGSGAAASGAAGSSTTGSGAAAGSGTTGSNAAGSSTSSKLDSLSTGTNNIHYNKILKMLSDQRVILPPSAAIAGAYASVDRERGIWKAPANISLQAVVAPDIQVTTEDQEGLNIDSTGKSINAIRSFPGSGTVVWGARTLDGNSNEWRFIPVRRLFISVEESVKKATAFAVFEPNDISTWLKVKGMIDSYLYTLWERGALQGTKAEQAFFVNVGLGKTMTTDDILAGKLIVEIGLAAVRPAEFIILRFSHKLAE